MSIGPWEILLVLLVILLLFGASKLPELARSVGRSARIFKSEVNEMQNDGKQQASADAPQREITQGPANQAQQSVEQGFWNQPQNQQPNQPGTNPNA